MERETNLPEVNESVFNEEIAAQIKEIESTPQIIAKA